MTKQFCDICGEELRSGNDRYIRVRRFALCEWNGFYNQDLEVHDDCFKMMGEYIKGKRDMLAKQKLESR